MTPRRQCTVTWVLGSSYWTMTLLRYDDRTASDPGAHIGLMTLVYVCQAECMLICIFDVRTLGGVDMLPAGAGIGEEQVSGSAPLVRALVVERLELMWRACEPHINTEMGKPDPRFIESGIRIVDRLSKLYRLDAPQAQENEPDAGSVIDSRELAARGLQELEAKVRERFS